MFLALGWYLPLGQWIEEWWEDMLLTVFSIVKKYLALFLGGITEVLSTSKKKRQYCRSCVHSCVSINNGVFHLDLSKFKFQVPFGLYLQNTSISDAPSLNMIVMSVVFGKESIVRLETKQICRGFETVFPPLCITWLKSLYIYSHFSHKMTRSNIVITKI